MWSAWRGEALGRGEWRALAVKLGGVKSDSGERGRIPPFFYASFSCFCSFASIALGGGVALCGEENKEGKRGDSKRVGASGILA